MLNLLWLALACSGGDTDKTTDTEPTGDETAQDDVTDTESTTDTEESSTDTEPSTSDTETPTDTETSTDTEAPTDTETTSDYELVDGSWDFIEKTSETNDCALSPAERGYLELDADSTIEVEIYNATYHYMYLRAVDLTVGFVCSHSDATFSCIDQSTEYDLEGYEGTHTFTYDLEGEWPSASELEVTYTVDVSCDGAGCDDLADDLGITYPCTYEVVATLEPS